MDIIYFDVNIEGGERVCPSMLQCFLYTVNYGIRNGGGIADTIIP